MEYLCDSCANCKASGYHPDFHDPSGPMRMYVVCSDGWTRWAVEQAHRDPKIDCPGYEEAT